MSHCGIPDSGGTQESNTSGMVTKVFDGKPPARETIKQHGYTEACLLWCVSGDVGAGVAAEKSILGQRRKKPVVSEEYD